MSACMHVRMYAYMNEWMHVCMYACMHACGKKEEGSIRKSKETYEKCTLPTCGATVFTS